MISSLGGRRRLGRRPATTPPAEPAATAPDRRRRLEVRAVTSFDPPPDGDGEENDDRADLAVDGDRSTAWTTKSYDDPFGPTGLKDGVGLVLDLGRRQDGRDRSRCGPPAASTDLEVRAADQQGSASTTSTRWPRRPTSTGGPCCCPTEALHARYLLRLADLAAGRPTVALPRLDRRGHGPRLTGALEPAPPTCRPQPGRAPVRCRPSARWWRVGQDGRTWRRAAGRRRCCAGPRRRRPGRLRRAGPPAPRPAVGGRAAHPRRPRGGRRRAAGRPALGLPGRPRRGGLAAATSAVTTWLHRIVVNACLDRVRRRAARPADPLPEHDACRPAATPSPPAITGLDVEAALRTLPVEQRGALVLVDMYGWSGRGGRRGPRLPDRHREEPVRPRPGPAAAAAARTGTPTPARPTSHRRTSDRRPTRHRQEVSTDDRRTRRPTSTPHLDPDALADLQEGLLDAGREAAAAPRTSRAAPPAGPTWPRSTSVPACWPRPATPDPVPDGRRGPAGPRAGRRPRRRAAAATRQPAP